MEMKEFVIAKPLTRFFATMLDWGLVLIIAFAFSFRPIATLINAIINNTNVNIVSLFLASFVSGGLVIITIVAYFCLIPALWNGQTLGKRLSGITTIKEDGSKPSFRSLFIREICRIFITLLTSGISIIVNIICLFVCKKHCCFYDILVSTKVVSVQEE